MTLANPYLVLGGLVTAVVVMGFGVLQVPGWAEKAHDAAALNTMANIADGQAAIFTTEGAYVSTMREMQENPDVQVTPAESVTVTHIGTNPEKSLWCGIVQSLTGRYFAGSDKVRPSGPYDTPTKAATGAQCDPTTITGLPPDGSGGSGLDGHTRFEFVIDTRLDPWCDTVDLHLADGKAPLAATVNWGDGSSEGPAVNGSNSHTFSTPGEYRVVVDGILPVMRFTQANQCVTSVPVWGDTATEDATLMFSATTNLQHVDAPPSTITNMMSMFQSSRFSGDVKDWDVSNVTNMMGMFFYNTEFNSPVNDWDVSNVENMTMMFSTSSMRGKFNQPVDKWDVSKVTSMSMLFTGQRDFNQNLSSWKTPSLTDASLMFSDASSFNGSVENFDMSNVLSIRGMFQNAASFNQPVGGWDTGKVTDMSRTFAGAASFNQPVSNWKTSAATSMEQMFAAASSFNRPLSGWDVSNVSNFEWMFSSASSFNQGIASWEMGNARSLDGMFRRASSFNQDLDRWNVSNVTDMEEMFYEASSFAGTVSSWDTSKVVFMQEMFNGASSFNGDLSAWNVKSVASDYWSSAKGFAGNAGAGIKLPQFTPQQCGGTLEGCSR